MAHNRRRAPTQEDLQNIERAIGCLIVARRFLRLAGAHHTAEYVAGALKSAHGAYNHARPRAEHLAFLAATKRGA